MSRRTLYVTGFERATRARELAYEFERFGRLVRCDIPAPRSPKSRLFAFVEYEDEDDARDAHRDMHMKSIGNRDREEVLSIEWARTPPSASWRFEVGRERDRGRGRSPRRVRSISPRRDGRGSRDYSPRDRDRDHDRGGRRDRDRDNDRDRDYDRSRRDRDRDYDRDRDRSRSPDPRDREKDDDRDDHDDRRDANGDDHKDSPVAAAEDIDAIE